MSLFSASVYMGGRSARSIAGASLPSPEKQLRHIPWASVASIQRLVGRLKVFKRFRELAAGTGWATLAAAHANDVYHARDALA